MTDPPSILAAYQSLKAATELLKGLRAIERGYNEAELKLRISELVDLVTQARNSVADAQEEIRALKGRIAQLEQAEDVRNRLVLRGNLYYLKDGDAERGPFCPRCIDADGKLMRVVRTRATFAGTFQCPACERYYS